MKPIESYPDKKRCEMCGATICQGLPDSTQEHSGAEVIRRLAFVADMSPSLAILLIHHIAGKTEREIAAKLKVSQQAIHGRIVRAEKTILSFSHA